MSRKGKLADIDPFGGDNPVPDAEDEERPSLSMSDADAALFGELARVDVGRQTVRPVSIFDVYPDVKQPRRAVPLQVRQHWSGQPRDIASLFNAWLGLISAERQKAGQPDFDLNDFLWAEAVEGRGRSEDDIDNAPGDAGPLEQSFGKIVELAVSIRRDGLVNPVTVQRSGRDQYQLETGERRWLAYHVLFGYFNGESGKPQERSKWENIPAIIVDEFSVWRQASENAARADLNAIGRARQFAILMMDLLGQQGVGFQDYQELVGTGESDRAYYAQVVPHRVPKGKGEMLSNGLGVSHRAAFTRCRMLLELPDEVWIIGDNLNLPEDELLRLARLEVPEVAIKEAQKIARNVANRNNSTATKPTKKSPRPPYPIHRFCRKTRKKAVF